MPNTADHVQTTLLPPEAIECILRLGLVGATEHAQLQLEIWNATDGTLLEMESRPSVPWGLVESAVEEAAQRLKQLARNHVVPF